MTSWNIFQRLKRRNDLYSCHKDTKPQRRTRSFISKKKILRAFVPSLLKSPGNNKKEESIWVPMHHATVRAVDLVEYLRLRRRNDLYSCHRARSHKEELARLFQRKKILRAFAPSWLNHQAIIRKKNQFVYLFTMPRFVSHKPNC